MTQRRSRDRKTAHVTQAVELLESRWLLTGDLTSTGTSSNLQEGTPKAITIPAVNQTGSLTVNTVRDASGFDISGGTTAVYRFTLNAPASVPITASASGATAPGNGVLFSIYTDDDPDSPGTLVRAADTRDLAETLIPNGQSKTFSVSLLAGTYFGRFVASADLSNVGFGSNGPSANVSYSANFGANPTPPPAAPTGLSVKPATTLPNRVDVSWIDNATNETGYKVERSTDGINFVLVGGGGANTTGNGNGGLTPGKTYYYRAYAYNDGGKSAYSNVGSIVIRAVPAAPTALTATVRSSSRIDLAWVDNASTETGFQIERSTDGVTFAAVKVVAANTRAYSDAAPAANTKYYYRVFAFNEGGRSAAATNVANATTRPLTIPTAPTGLAVVSSPAVPGAVDLNWADNSNNEDAFKIESSTDGLKFAALTDVGLDVKTYRITGLAVGKKMYYRVYAYNKAGKSAYTNVGSITIPAAPAAPSGLTATSLSTSRIDLAWLDNSPTESGFQIERSTNGTTFTALKIVAANVRTFSDSAPAANTKYYYRVYAFNAGGKSAVSAVASATTRPLTIPAAPTTLTIKVSTSVAHALELAWLDKATNEDAYKVERSTDGITFTALADVPLNGTSYRNTGLTAGKRYYYRVYAYNKAGRSTYSNVVSAIAT